MTIQSLSEKGRGNGEGATASTGLSSWHHCKQPLTWQWCVLCNTETGTEPLKVTNIVSAFLIDWRSCFIAELLNIWQYTLSIEKIAGRGKHCQNWLWPRDPLLPAGIARTSGALGSVFPANQSQKLQHSTLHLVKLLELFLVASDRLSNCSGQPLPPPRSERRRVCYCGWTLEGSLSPSVLCRCSCCCCCCGAWCCWWCDGGKPLCCSGNAAERMSWAEGLPWSNLEV